LHGLQRQAELRLRLAQHLRLQGFALTGAGTDDKCQQTFRAAELSAVEHKLRGRRRGF